MVSVHWLNKDSVVFPPYSEVGDDGLIAAGGDLSVPRLVAAYHQGIFPWYEENQPILWWSPDPRFILTPSEIHISRSMSKILRQNNFQITTDTAYKKVIKACAKIPRKGSEATWITPDMVNSYIDLFDAGFAHSIEVWEAGKLQGGLYGVSIGKVFFGESMFSFTSNASKIALIILALKLKEWDYGFIDCQVESEHLSNMGAKLIPREKFLTMLKYHVKRPHHPWVKQSLT